MTPTGHARNRILLSFLFGIALPSGLLGYLAFRGIQNDRALVEREQRTRLLELAAQIRLTVEERLNSLESALALITTAGSVGSEGSPDIDKLVRDEPLVQAVFLIRAGGPLRVVAASSLMFRMEGDQPASARAMDEWTTGFDSARTRELRADDLEGSLTRYQRLAHRAGNERQRAEALTAIARVQRNLGQLGPSGDTYRQIRDELGHERLPGGMPYGAAAGLEYGEVLLEAGDSTAGVGAYIQFYESLVAGRWLLTQAQFELLATRARDVLVGIAGGEGSSTHDSTVTDLVAAETASRAHAESLLAFQTAARGQLDDGFGMSRRSVIGSGGRAFHAVLLTPHTSGAAVVTWGLLLDTDALARYIVRVLPPDQRGSVVVMLRTQAGGALVTPDAATVHASPTVTASLGGFPPWNLELSPQSVGVTESFLTSRRAAYLYAFVLLAGILLFGLVLTSRSVGRELELARMQSDFVSTVSHEFKSPLTAIRQLAEMLKADLVPSEDRRRRYYDVLLEQSERLSRLIENVLDFARMDEGRREMIRESVDVNALVEATVMEAQHRVIHEGFAVRTELEDALPTAWLDAEAIRQALNNLIDNGVKYSGTSKEVVVSSFRTNAHLVITVRDFGIGLAPDEAGKVFDRFYRGGGPLTRSVKGTGLGLTLVRQIVGAHGGTVDVESEVGHGSTFSIRLPLASGDTAAIPDARAP